MENLETIIKNAARRMKKNNQLFDARGGNLKYKPRIIIYENGYVVGMYHRNYRKKGYDKRTDRSAEWHEMCHIEEKIYDGKQFGQHIVTCTFDFHVFYLKVHHIVWEINRQIEHEKMLQNEFDKINNISL